MARMVSRGAVVVSGEVEVELDGILVARFPNLIVDGYLDELAKSVRGVEANLQTLQIALGDDSTAPANGDTALGNERIRKQVTKQSDAGTGKATTEVLFTSGEANFQIEEVGFYAGGATSTPGSGLLVSRVLYSHAKTSGESLTIRRTVTYARP